MRVACVNQDRGIAPGARKGAAVHVAAMRQAFAQLGAQVIACDQKDPAALRDALDEAHAVGRLDLVYERYALGAAEGSRFAAQHGLPHIVELNAPLRQEASRWRGAIDDARILATEREVFRRARRIVAVSRAVAAGAVEAGAVAEHVLVRPNAVDATLFFPRPRSEPIDGLGVSEDRFVIGFHGRLRPWHGLPLLADAVALLLARDVDAVLLLVGEGDWHAAIGNRLPPDRVLTLGWRPQAEIARVVSRFDALALSYSPEEPCWFSPLKLLEAMASGAVPVVPDLGDLAQVVRHGVDGLVYRPGEVAELAGALQLLARDPAWRLRLAVEAVRTARKSSWVALAREVLGEAGAGAGL